MFIVLTHSSKLLDKNLYLLKNPIHPFDTDMYSSFVLGILSKFTHDSLYQLTF